MNLINWWIIDDRIDDKLGCGCGWHVTWIFPRIVKLRGRIRSGGLFLSRARALVVMLEVVKSLV